MHQNKHQITSFLLLLITPKAAGDQQLSNSACGMKIGAFLRKLQVKKKLSSLQMTKNSPVMVELVKVKCKKMCQNDVKKSNSWE